MFLDKQINSFGGCINYYSPAMKKSNLIPCLYVIFLFSCGDHKMNEEKSNVTAQGSDIPEASSSLQDSISNEKFNTSEILNDSLEVTAGASEVTNLDSIQTSGVSEGNEDSLQIIESRRADPTLFATVAPGLSHRITATNLPKSTTIGIKSYPNAYVVKLNTKTQYKGKMYVTMELASEDQPEEVLAFYNTWRDNWHYIEDSEVHTFKKDKDKYFRETNTLQILPFSKSLDPELDSLLSFTPRTLIRIYYEDIN